MGRTRFRYPGINSPTTPAPHPLKRAAEGYQAMDQRRATKVLLTL